MLPSCRDRQTWGPDARVKDEPFPLMIFTPVFSQELDSKLGFNKTKTHTICITRFQTPAIYSHIKRSDPNRQYFYPHAVEYLGNSLPDMIVPCYEDCHRPL